MTIRHIIVMMRKRKAMRATSNARNITTKYRQTDDALDMIWDQVVISELTVTRQSDAIQHHLTPTAAAAAAAVSMGLHGLANLSRQSKYNQPSSQTISIANNQLSLANTDSDYFLALSPAFSTVGWCLVVDISARQ